MFTVVLTCKYPQNWDITYQPKCPHVDLGMDSAKLLRRTICRLAKEVDKHHDRISVNAMLDLSAQIKRSDFGKRFASHPFSPFVLLFENMISFVVIYTLDKNSPLAIPKHCFNIHMSYDCFVFIS
jgi:hypothetical protein